jgi:hypothetical protein
MPAFLVVEAKAEADEEVVETGAELVDEPTNDPVDESAEAEEVAVVMVLVHKELTALGIVTPAVVQICFAYSVATC